MLRTIFAKQDAVLGTGIYQFPDSDHAFGRVLISAEHHRHYVREKIVPGMRIAKLNFDFDADGNVLDKELFVIVVEANGLTFKELLNGRMVSTTRCLSCHKEVPDKIYFKSRYNGLRFTYPAQRLRLR